MLFTILYKNLRKNYMAEKNDTVFTDDKRSSDYIEAGKIVNTHGIKGSVK